MKLREDFAAVEFLVIPGYRSNLAPPDGEILSKSLPPIYLMDFEVTHQMGQIQTTSLYLKKTSVGARHERIC